MLRSTIIDLVESNRIIINKRSMLAAVVEEDIKIITNGRLNIIERMMVVIIINNTRRRVIEIRIINRDNLLKSRLHISLRILRILLKLLVINSRNLCKPALEMMDSYC